MGGGGKVMSVTFELAGQRLIALNGGPHYQLTPAFSLFVSVTTQAELDRIWDALLAGGGKPSRCGWLVDRFGLSWQVVPTVLGKLMSDPDPERSSRAVQAMMGMVKLDIAALERAAAGG
ncbi:MAG TPA: VOC family protein [Polyangiaceae bacterium]|nr:VOC family protein [Polyangiaceae bacterium]